MNPEAIGPQRFQMRTASNEHDVVAGLMQSSSDHTTNRSRSIDDITHRSRPLSHAFFTADLPFESKMQAEFR
ncbi:hypothetical protein Pd630_LPD16167 (plasmid) [Rhodococcus opacus PD630]|nr:hypothetical protein Pd630_LPD16167 [Rhodococcus opacus PD630]